MSEKEEITEETEQEEKIKKKMKEAEKKEKPEEKNEKKVEIKKEIEIKKEVSKEKKKGEPKERRERRKIREEEAKKEEIAKWQPKTSLGRAVKEGKIKDIDEIFDKHQLILEHQIIDILLPLQSELINIGQAKGKFGGGKRRPWRQTQKKTAEGNTPSFACMIVVGDCNGHIGIGMGKARETLPARGKAIKNAKLNLIRVKRGCGSFNCVCNEEHSIPVTVNGKEGSARITLMPAPKGTGLAIEDECKKVLRLAGIKDIYSRTAGQTRTKFNLIKACFKALQKTDQFKK